MYLPLLPATAILSLLLSASAVAEVVHVTLPPLVVEGGFPPGMSYLDLDLNGSEDVVFQHYLVYEPLFWSNASQVASFGSMSEQLIIFDDLLPKTRLMQVGEEIGPNSGYWSFEGSLAQAGTYFNFGYWLDGESHYMALRFRGQDYEYHYAWINIAVDIASHTTVLEYAYSTEPNVPVYAGVVPEPSALAACILGGVALRRRRRQ